MLRLARRQAERSGRLQNSARALQPQPLTCALSMRGCSPTCVCEITELRVKRVCRGHLFGKPGAPLRTEFTVVSGAFGGCCWLRHVTFIILSKIQFDNRYLKSVEVLEPRA